MSNSTALASDLYRLYAHPNEETFKFDYFSHRFRFIAKENVWDSDWKFEAGDAAHFIAEILGKEFTFSYPEDAYSKELFPQLQAALDKDNLQLMNTDSLGGQLSFFYC